MSLAGKAAGSLLWATLAGVAARATTIASTFVLTRYLSPEVQGEVNLAFVFVATVGAVTALGVSQYVAAHPREGPDTAFHGTVLVLGAGIVGALGAMLAGPTVARWVEAPGMLEYVPGMLLAHGIDRCGWLPRSLLVRDMRFRALGLKVALSELAFAICSVGFAALGRGGHAIVLGGLSRSAVGLVFLLALTDRRQWLSRCPLSCATIGKLLRFGAPLSIASLCRIGATSWDNTFIGARFGESAVGVYNQAYRLAELPSTAVGEQCNDVLVPTFARASGPDARLHGYLRAAGLVTFAVAPMALGLAAVAPTLVAVFYPPAYAGVAPFLVILAPLGLIRPVASLSAAFLQVTGRTRVFLIIDGGLVVLVLGLMAILAPSGEVPCAAGVVLAFLMTLTVMLSFLRPHGITMGAVLRAVARPLGAAVLMAAGVVGLRHALRPLGAPDAIELLAEVACGGATYAAASLVIARAVTRDFVDLVRGIVRRGRGATADA